MLNGIINRRKIESVNMDPLELLANAESGECRESISDQLQSPTSRAGMKSLYFLLTDVPEEFVLAREPSGADFLMSAKLSAQKRVFSIYLHKPSERAYSESSPEFRLSWSPDTQIWSASVEAETVRCDTCLYNRRNPSLVEVKPRFLEIKQDVEDGGSNSRWYHMEVSGLSTEFGDRVLECARCKCLKAENVSPSNQSGAKRRIFPEFHLHSVTPSVSSVGELSIKFEAEDRKILASARNVQLMTQSIGKCAQVVFQFMRVDGMRFKLDYRSPVSVAQAFCMALSTHFWA